MDKVMLYTENGNNYHGDNHTLTGAEAHLRRLGYTAYYKGRHYLDNRICIVGINGQNTVGLMQRRQNGLLYAQEHKLERS